MQAAFRLRRFKVTALTAPNDRVAPRKPFVLVNTVVPAFENSMTFPVEGKESIVRLINLHLLKLSNPFPFDDSLVQSLVRFILKDPLKILRSVWLSEDANQRAMRFYKIRIKYDGSVRFLLDLIENSPIGVIGNLVAFPLATNQAETTEYEPTGDSLAVDTFCCLPSQGVYAETMLSKYPATEIMDATRPVDYEYLKLVKASDITGIGGDLESRHASASDVLAPSQFGQTMISQLNAPTLPKSSAFDLLQTVLSVPFRDMSYASDTVSAASQLGTETSHAVTELGDQTAELTKTALTENAEMRKDGYRMQKSLAQKAMQLAGSSLSQSVDPTRMLSQGQALSSLEQKKILPPGSTDSILNKIYGSSSAESAPAQSSSLEKKPSQSASTSMEKPPPSATDSIAAQAPSGFDSKDLNDHRIGPSLNQNMAPSDAYPQSGSTMNHSISSSPPGAAASSS